MHTYIWQSGDGWCM